MSHFKIKDFNKRWATIMRMHDAGCGVWEIAAHVGMSPGGVYKVLADNRRTDRQFKAFIEELDWQKHGIFPPSLADEAG